MCDVRHPLIRTLQTIGVNSTPVTDLEFLFLILNNVVGVCMFAILVGNISIILSSINANRTKFQEVVDNTKAYMRQKNIPEEFQDQVKRW